MAAIERSRFTTKSLSLQFTGEPVFALRQSYPTVLPQLEICELQEPHPSSVIHEGHRFVGLCLYFVRILRPGRVRIHFTFDESFCLAEEDRQIA